jgi:hypothetical protein
MKKGISLFLGLLFIYGCGQKKGTVSYSEDTDHGLKKEQTVGEVHYVVQYKPASYIVEKEHLDSAEAKTRLNQFKGMLWFNVSFSIEGFGQSPLRYKVSGLSEYSSRQDYYLNQAPKDMYMLYGNDSLYVDSYWFENNQNLAPFETMVVGFRLPDGDSIPRHDLKFSFYDRVFKNGIIKTIISKEDINQVQ